MSVIPTADHDESEVFKIMNLAQQRACNPALLDTSKRIHTASIIHDVFFKSREAVAAKFKSLKKIGRGNRPNPRPGYVG